MMGEQGMVPWCFSLQILSLPGIIYFISLVRLPNTENELMSVCRPGIKLDELGLVEPVLQGE
jgi:hypothetical protein